MVWLREILNALGERLSIDIKVKDNTSDSGSWGKLLQKLLTRLTCFKKTFDPHPLHVQWFLTRKCNYKCKSCQIWKQPPCNELSTAEVKSGIDVLQKMRVVELVFTGGNPLLRNDISEILKYSYEKFPVVSIFDNGSMAYKKINCLKFVDAVCISLNTLNPELQNNMSGVPVAFQNAVLSIEKLKSVGIRTIVSITISDANVNDAADLIEHFGRKGIEILLCLYSDISPPDSLVKIGIEDSFFKFKSTGPVIKFIEQLKKLRKKYLVHIDPKTIRSLYNFFSSGTRDWICDALTSFFIVNEQGDVAGCNVMPSFGKIWDLPTIWSSNQINEIRQKNKQCTKCTYLCYAAYSNINNFSNLVRYALSYEARRFLK